MIMTMKRFSKSALIVAIAAATIAPSAFAQGNQPAARGGWNRVGEGAWYPGLYASTVDPGVQLEGFSIAPALTGGGSFGYNSATQDY